MSIRVRLVLVLIAGFAVLLGLLYAANQMQGKIQYDLERIHDESSELILRAELAQVHLYRQLLAWSNLQLRGSRPGEYYRYLQAFYEQERLTRSFIQDLQQQVESLEIPGSVTEAFIESYYDLAVQFRFALKIYNHSDEPARDTDEYLNPYITRVLQQYAEFEADIQTQRDILLKEAKEKKAPAQLFFVLIFLLNMSVFLLIFIWWVDRNIGKPLMTSISSAKSIAAGNVKQRFPDGMPGEFSLFASAFNNMMDRLEASNSQLLQRMDELTREIRRRELLEQELQEKKVAAEQAARAKTEFLSTMSHEIRTPLNVVIGYSELLAETELNDKQRRYISSINHGADSLLAVIDDVLDLAKIDAGKLVINVAEFSLHRLLDSIEDMFKPKASAKGLALEVQRSGKVPEVVTTDQNRLMQILFNLLSNALKFTERGKVVLRVEAEVIEGDQANLLFTVTDTGIGISPEYQQRVFNRFEQQDGQDTRRYGGSGLGLAISQQLAAMLGGELRLDKSVPNQGSQFSLRLNRVAIASAGVTSPASQSITTLKLKPCRILVVDDFAANRQLVIDLLQGQPVAFAEAENGRIALEVARTFKPDLVIMDLKMPEMDGVTATRAMREDKALADIPVIALTASAIRSREDEVRQELFADFLTKPIDIPKLFAALERHLR